MVETPCDSEIFEVLHGFDRNMKKLRQEISDNYVLLVEISNDSNKEELIRALSMPGSQEGGRARNAEQVLDGYEYFVKSEIDRTWKYISELTDRYERNNRIMACFRALPKKERAVLGKVIKSPEHPVETYNTLAEDMDCTYRTILRIRRSALNRIKKMYGSKTIKAEDLMKGKGNEKKDY